MARRPPAYPELAPTTRRQQRRQVTLDVRAQVDPIARELARGITARTQAGSRNITGVSDALSRSLEGYGGQQREIFDRARANLGAVNQGVAAGFEKAGAGISEDLAKRIQSAGGDPASAEQFAAATKGTGASMFTRDSAELGQLAGTQANAELYASKLPGLARLSGLQGVRDLEAGSQQQLADQSGDLRARVPGLVSEALGSERRLAFEKAVARLGFSGDIRQQDIDYETKLAAEQGRRQRAAAAERGRNQRASQSELGKNERASAERQLTAEQKALDREQRMHENTRDDAARLRLEDRIEKRQKAIERLKAKLKGTGGAGDSGVKPKD